MKRKIVFFRKYIVDEFKKFETTLGQKKIDGVGIWLKLRCSKIVL